MLFVLRFDVSHFDVSLPCFIARFQDLSSVL